MAGVRQRPAGSRRRRHLARLFLLLRLLVLPLPLAPLCSSLLNRRRPLRGGASSRPPRCRRRQQQRQRRSLAFLWSSSGRPMSMCMARSRQLRWRQQLPSSCLVFRCLTWHHSMMSWWGSWTVCWHSCRQGPAANHCRAWPGWHMPCQHQPGHPALTRCVCGGGVGWGAEDACLLRSQQVTADCFCIRWASSAVVCIHSFLPINLCGACAADHGWGVRWAGHRQPCGA